MTLLLQVSMAYRLLARRARTTVLAKPLRLRKGPLLPGNLRWTNTSLRSSSWNMEVRTLNQRPAVVIWGMSQTEEKRLLREIRRFEVERLAHEDIESEDLNWYLADYSR